VRLWILIWRAEVSSLSAMVFEHVIQLCTFAVVNLLELLRTAKSGCATFRPIVFSDCRG
jgi:hypothetical protein